MKTIIIILLSIFILESCNQSTKQDNTTSANKKSSEILKSIPDLSYDTTFTFNGCQRGVLPEGWSQYTTGKGDSTNWQVIYSNSKIVLAQLSEDNPNYHFNVIVFDNFKIKNPELSVYLQGVSGNMDQGGGLVWRFIDKNNYYVVRANPLEDNVVLYKVENGKRTDLPLIGKGRTYGTDVKPLGSGWNQLGLTVNDSLFTVYLNSEQVFQVIDETFKNAGKVGLWTKADAVTNFDNFEIKPLKNQTTLARSNPLVLSKR